MTERLPTPGVDTNWGTILNGYLKVEHDAAGTHGPLLDKNNIFNKAQRGSILELLYSPTLEINLNESNRFKCTLTGNITISNPTNIVEGQGGIIYIKQDSMTYKTVSWGTNWKLLSTIPTEDRVVNKINVYAYEVYDSNTIVLSYIGSV